MLNTLFQTLVCARRIKYLKTYGLLINAWKKEIWQTTALAENLLPVRPKYIFDGGFHKGWFSYTLSLFYPDIEICGCDPIENRDGWMISPSLPVTFFNVALSDTPGSANLLLINDPQLHSLLPFNENYEDTFGQTYQATNAVKTVSVSTIDIVLSKMDWDRCDLLKLAIQGSELDALKGAKKNLEKIAAIYLEISFEQIYHRQAVFHEIDDFLRENGFSLSKILNPRGGKYLLQADALYLNNSFYPPC